MKKIKSRSLRIIIYILLSVSAVVILVSAAYLIILHTGRGNLTGDNTGKPTLPDYNVSDSDPSYDPNDTVRIPETRDPDADVYFNGDPYKYLDNLINIVIMGVDKVSEETGARAQADTIALLSYDEKNNSANIIMIPRDTICDVAVFDIEGNPLGKRKLQLALAYSYGKNDTDGAELTVEAVSSLFYGLPIHAWAAVYMDAVPAVNDAVGGVTVTLDDDMEGLGSVGDVITLHGDKSLLFLRSRDSSVTESTLFRMQRQSSYVNSLLSSVKASAKRNPLIITELCSIAFEHSITNLSFDSAVYLASNAVKINDIDFDSVEGTLVSAVPWAEFHADPETLYNLILNKFYKSL